MAAVADGSVPTSSAPHDLEKAAPPPAAGEAPGGVAGDGASGVVASVLRRWRREDLLEKGGLLLRALACLFSLVSLLVMASNKHGDWRDFDHYEEYRYVLAIAILAFLYSLGQILRQVKRFNTGRDVVPRQSAGMVDFVGDQVLAYLLISALSAAIPITNRMREGADNMFTDASAASISMAFFAFLALALSALISGYKLCKQAYI